MMRSFGARADTHVVDEPFYAAYLATTGIVHPMREEVIASQPNDWHDVVDELLGPIPDDKPIYYQKHMTHHMIPEIGREWMRKVTNAFLVRDPRAVLASYVVKRSEVTLADIGIVQQHELFALVADRQGSAPPVVEGVDVLHDPTHALSKLCAALGIAFSDSMLRWPAGRRTTDGVWAPAWYQAVERSTGFDPPRETDTIELPNDLERIAEAARPHYEAIVRYKL
jgi:hypothetical protein